MNILDQATQIFHKHFSAQIAKVEDDHVKEILWFKLRHSFGVLEMGKRIVVGDAKLKNLSVEEKQNLSAALLLHDLGRFYQTNGNRYLTNQEFEHGDAGYNLLKQEGITDSAILLAVKFHNKLHIDDMYKMAEYTSVHEEEQERIKLFVYVVRDADKIDNIAHMTDSWEDPELEKKEPDQYISEKVLETLEAKKVVKHADQQTKLDGVINVLTWNFDLNFEGSKQLFHDLGFPDFTLKQIALCPKDQQDRVRAVINEKDF